MWGWIRRHKVWSVIGALVILFFGLGALGAALGTPPPKARPTVTATPSASATPSPPQQSAPVTPPPTPTPTHTATPSHHSAPVHPSTRPPATHAPAAPRPVHTTHAPPPPPPVPEVVHPGAFCAPEGALGVTDRGTPMICGPASDGRNRWHKA